MLIADDGARTMGRFVAIVRDAVSLEVGGTSRSVPLDRVARITRTRRGIVLGTILGLGAGIPLGLAARTYARNEAGSPAQAFLLVSGIGVASGIAIDEALNLPRTVYDRERQRTISIGPRVGPHLLGATVRVTF